MEPFTLQHPSTLLRHVRIQLKSHSAFFIVLSLVVVYKINLYEIGNNVPRECGKEMVIGLNIHQLIYMDQLVSGAGGGGGGAILPPFAPINTLPPTYRVPKLIFCDRTACEGLTTHVPSTQIACAHTAVAWTFMYLHGSIDYIGGCTTTQVNDFE
jgi:hypothetical protein